MTAPSRRSRRAAVVALAALGGGGSLALLADLSRWPALALVVLASALAAGEAWAQADDDCVDDADPLCLPSALAVLATLAWAAHDAGARAVPSAMAAAALALMAAGATLRVAAVAALGRHFVSQARAHDAGSRVRRGPYAVMRHPSELGLVAVALGAALAAGSPGALGLSVGVVLPLSLVRMRREERATFGESRA